MNKNLYDKLINKYLDGKTSREEENLILDICLKDINSLIIKYREYKKRNEQILKGDEE